MEEAAEVHRAESQHAYQDWPQLNDSLKDQLATLLTDAATLERRYQSVIDAESRNPGTHINELDQLQRKWVADRGRFIDALKEAGSPAPVLQFVTSATGQMADRIVCLRQASSNSLS